MRRTPEGKLLTKLILETFRLHGALLTAGNKLTKPFGLTTSEWQVIGAIGLAKQPMTVAQIARRMRLARQGVQRIVNDLVHLGLVRFIPNMNHRRSQLLEITEKGAAIMIDANRAQLSWVNKLSDDLSTRQIEQTLALLETTRLRAAKMNQQDN